ncbi:Beta-lactamase enzyme family protein [Geodermatophilus obscurus]|uniref:Beta-lactamase enzyme family protein n=1 Tax=Geodermatophilus obscurus TaxID=1861 RepID=A0A1I5CV99_9ACTN|nr:Beta-lactamase enzyme family protein [Geodermatophilus obscurus]
MQAGGVLLLPPSRQRRRGLAARAATAALAVVLTSLLVVGGAGTLVVVLAGGRGTPAPAVAAGVAGSLGDAAGRSVAGAATLPPAPDTAEDRLLRVGTPGPRASSPPVDAAAVLAAVEAAATAAGGSIALAVVGTDGTPLVTSPDAGDPVYTASLVKLLVVGRLLALEATGAVALTDGDRSLMERAIVRSDDPAMSVLWDRWGGAALVTDTASAAGLTGTGLPAVPGQWGEATTTAADVAGLLARRDAVLGPGPAAILLDWMRATSPTAADGFGQDFGLLAGDPAGTVAAKQGWMCCVRGTRQLHSAGVLPGGQVVVLLGDFPSGTSWGRARTALDTAAAAVRAAAG